MEAGTHGSSTLVRTWRAVPVLAGLAALVLVAAALVVGVLGDHAFRSQKTREATMQAQVVAASVTAALAFDDHDAARKFIGALRANPEIEYAALFDERGRKVASYTRPGDAYEAKGRDAPIQVSAPVVEAGSQLGSVTLRETLEPLGRRLSRYAGIGLLVGMAAILTAVLGAAHMILRRANQDLAQANRALRGEIAHREKIEEALRQSQKMEAIGRMTGGVAHDFNNLLMIASSGLELLERTEDPARRRILKDGIRQAVDRGASLTRQLLAFSRRTPLNPEVVSLSDRIEGMRVLLDRSLREDVTVRLDLPAGLWPVEVDPGQLELAVLNLAVNARDAMPEGGRISLSAENLPGLDDGVLSGDFVRLRIADTGSGMSPETVSRVFEPFFTTKEVGKGTGLGLSQVYGFLQASGGDVRIESRLGEGTTLSLYLPRATAAVEPAPEAKAVRPLSSEARGAALLVEDDDGVATMVQGMMEALGWSVERVADAASALRCLEGGAAYRLVLSDTVMPGALNGLDLAREIARRWPDLPVLLTTGYSESASAALREGRRMLVKPYSLETLARELDAAIAEARLPAA
jgi:signal transduction histidine kinase/CheY-like chemotaxis protein